MKGIGSRKFFIVALIISCAIGVVIGRLIPRKELGQTQPNDRLVREGGFRLINPLLFCEISGNKDFEEFQSLKNKITALINDGLNNGLVISVSVYFRNLNNGHWLGINENERYSPASLLKVPTMIAFFKFAESNPEILTKKVTYNGQFNDNKSEDIRPEKPIEPNRSYTIEELIKAMIVYSDNNATRLLHENIDPRALSDVYTDLGLSVPQTNGEVDFMSAKTYSHFFRVLYNASYLNRTDSEKAIELLTETDFPEGIRTGIKGNITVAEKFGERTLVNPDGRAQFKELHDCGIIYYPGHPYLLCVMTKGGRNFQDRSKMISDISRIVFDEVGRE